MESPHHLYWFGTWFPASFFSPPPESAAPFWGIVPPPKCSGGGLLPNFASSTDRKIPRRDLDRSPRRAVHSRGRNRWPVPFAVLPIPMQSGADPAFGWTKGDRQPRDCALPSLSSTDLPLSGCRRARPCPCPRPDHRHCGTDERAANATARNIATPATRAGMCCGPPTHCDLPHARPRAGWTAPNRRPGVRRRSV